MARDSVGIGFEGQGVGMLLPMRPEKKLLPVPVPTIDFMSPEFKKEQRGFFDSLISLGNLNSRPVMGYKAQGASIAESSTFGDYFVSRPSATFTDYITIRINGRNMDQYGVPATYRFLINPHTLNVSRNQIEAQSMTRSGWQVGSWGDDIIEISLEGVTCGQYFTLGLTNNWGEHTASYRNFMEFLAVFENNGYWFEGEGLDTSALASDATRRRIRYHSDVELRVGNFIWRGCFTGLEVSEDADRPHQISFSATFMAWKERFTSSSPWRDSIHNDVYRGHSFEAITSAMAKAKEIHKNSKGNAAIVGGAESAVEEFSKKSLYASPPTPPPIPYQSIGQMFALPLKP